MPDELKLEFSSDQIQLHPKQGEYPGQYVIPRTGGYLSIADDLSIYTHPDALDKEAFVKPKVQPSSAYTTLLAFRAGGVRHVIVWPK